MRHLGVVPVLLLACTNGTDVPQGPGPLGPGKLLNGPPAVWLLSDADGGVTGAPSRDADGGWRTLVVGVGARNVHPEGATLTFTVKDPVTLAPVLPPTVMTRTFNVEDGGCVTRGVPVALGDRSTLVHLVPTLAVTVVDKDGRQAETQVAVPILGPTDGGTLDASDAGVQMDGSELAGGG